MSSTRGRVSRPRRAKVLPGQDTSSTVPKKVDETDSSSTSDEQSMDHPRKPIVTDVEFDARFLQWDENRLGFLDVLVHRPLVDTTGRPQLQTIPDSHMAPPNDASLIGRTYQARIPRRETPYLGPTESDYPR